MRLLDEWKEWAEQVGNLPVPSSGYFLAKDCDAILNKNGIIVRNSWNDVVSSSNFGADEKTAFHLGLLPQPFMGDLKRAEIYILTLNPGYSPVDYFGEYCVSGYREVLLRNLRQDHSPHRLPNLFLDPQFAWSGGYEYWHSRLRGVIAEFAKKRGWTYAKARSKLSEKLAIIEFVPYHSASFNDSLKSGLKSPQLAGMFVEQYVSNRLQNGNAVTIVLRGLKHWKPYLPSDLCEKDGLVRYDPQREARFAHLTPKTRGGKAIIDWLCR